MKDYSGYSWIKVKKYKMDESLSWEERYKQLEAHHIEETTFLINEVREVTNSVNLACKESGIVFVNLDKTVYYPYNESFEFYDVPKVSLKRAQEFIDKRNECKGGVWVLHTKEQYLEWYKSKGQHLEYIKKMNLQ